MPTSRITLRTIRRLALCCVLLTGFLHGQIDQNKSGQELNRKSRGVISTLKMGAYGPVTPEQVAAASQPGRLIPFLEARFAHIQDMDKKGNIADALVGLGDKDNTYWDFLVEQAIPALDSDAPNPRSLTPGEHSNQYNAWLSAHNIAPGSPAESALNNLPHQFEYLATAHDARAIPLLRKALQSPNWEIESEAANGLAEFQHDKAAIPLIIDAVKKAPPDEARMIAGSLKFFDDDPLAKSVVEKYFPTPNPVEALKKDSNGSGDSETALPSDLERAVKAHAVQAIPILEHMFEQRRNDTYKSLPADTSNLSDKEKYSLDARHLNEMNEEHIASALIRLGVKDDVYWNYLVEQATLALDYNPPFPIRSGADGPSPQFVAWTKAHNTSVQAAATDATYIFPAKVALLAETGDPRGIPLLRKALLSQNFMIQSFAAMGLAKLNDKHSIPLIIEACKGAPPDAAAAIARSLLYFDDRQAQDAAQKYMPREMLNAFRESKKLPGSDPFH